MTVRTGSSGEAPPRPLARKVVFARVAAVAYISLVVIAAGSPVQVLAAGELDQQGHSAGLERAVANYRSLLSGEKQYAQLSPSEREEIDELQALLKATHVRAGNTREDCVAEQMQMRGAVLTRLEAKIVDLICSQRND